MKISKNQLVINESACSEIEMKLSNVLWPFEYQIYKRRINPIPFYHF